MPGGPGLAKEDQVEDVRPFLDGRGRKSRPKDIDPKLLKDLLEKMPKNQKVDPKQFEKLLKENPNLQNREFLHQLEQLLKDDRFPDNLQQQIPPEQLGDKQELKDKLHQFLEEGKKDAGHEVLPKNVDAPKIDGQDVPTTKPGETTGDKPSVADNEWVKWLDKNFSDAPGSDSAMKDLVTALKENGGKGKFGELPDFKSGGLKGLDEFGKSHSNNGWKVRPPDMHGNSPKFGGGGSSWNGGSSGGGGSSWGGGGGGGLGGGGTALAVIIGIGGAFLLAILLFRKWKINREVRASLMTSGPVPIDFDSIRSREQLVRVFNSVSLEQCGADARTWNHRVIADRFGKAKPAHAEPAEEVAGLYERARYAPTDEDLTAGEFADARRDLRVLGGATA